MMDQYHTGSSFKALSPIHNCFFSDIHKSFKQQNDIQFLGYENKLKTSSNGVKLLWKIILNNGTNSLKQW